MSNNPNRPDHYGVAAKLTRQEREAVKAAAWAEGVTVANYVRRCINAALLDASDDGILLRDVTAGRRARYTQADEHQAVTLRAAGLTYEAIARRIGCSASLVYHWINYDRAAIRRDQSRRRSSESAAALSAHAAGDRSGSSSRDSQPASAANRRLRAR